MSQKSNALFLAATFAIGLYQMSPSQARSETSQPSAPANTAGSCASSEFRQLDFWVGRWNVFNTGTTERVGSSLIERLYGGCAIRENWSEPGLTGGSLTSYDPVSKRWRQAWIDASGARRDFIGGWQASRMVLVYTHPSVRLPGATADERMTFTVNRDGSVRQYSDASLDGGKTWLAQYDYTYRRAQSPVASAPRSATVARGCASPESRQFDFWVGRWTVASQSNPDRKVADSLIENLYSGCAVRENWTPLSAAGGGSLSSYDPAARAWRQTWVDSSGARVDFTGGWNGQAMVLAGIWPQPGHPKQMTRMTYSVVRGGAVRQRGETSDDEGGTWQPSFDFIYSPAVRPLPDAARHTIPASVPAARIGRRTAP